MQIKHEVLFSDKWNKTNELMLKTITKSVVNDVVLL